jgi:hypothetical protein
MAMSGIVPAGNPIRGPKRITAAMSNISPKLQERR